MWSIIKELKTDFTVSCLQEFLEFTFNHEIIEIYHQRDNIVHSNETARRFHFKMAKELFE